MEFTHEKVLKHICARGLTDTPFSSKHTKTIGRTAPVLCWCPSARAFVPRVFRGVVATAMRPRQGVLPSLSRLIVDVGKQLFLLGPDLCVAHFTRAQVGVCRSQFDTVRLWVWCVVTLHLVRHTTSPGGHVCSSA